MATTSRTIISRSMYQAAYELGVKVLAGEITQAAAKRELVSEHGFTQMTASSYLGTYIGLRRGGKLRLTVNTESHQFMLEKIAADGPEALYVALKTLYEHIVYLESLGNSVERALRQLHCEMLAALSTHALIGESHELFEDQVTTSLQDSSAARDKRLAEAAPVPEVSYRLVKVLQRNADVVAAVQVRANGICEHCCMPAPFKRRDGRPFLEVHHRIPLALDGLDTVENAIALCPNCHRELHFGKDSPLQRSHL